MGAKPTRYVHEVLAVKSIINDSMLWYHPYHGERSIEFQGGSTVDVLVTAHIPGFLVASIDETLEFLGRETFETCHDWTRVAVEKMRAAGMIVDAPGAGQQGRRIYIGDVFSEDLNSAQDALSPHSILF